MEKRIFIQSSTDIDKISVYKEGIKNHAQMILPNYSFEIGGVKKSFPAEFMVNEFFNSKEILRNIIHAEKNGFDAIALHCFLDPVLDEARELVNIPVVSMAESSMLMSLMYGKKFAIVTYTPQLAKKSFPNLINKYGLRQHSIDTQYFEVSLRDLENAFSNPEPVINQFLDACEKAVNQGAEVILPGCGLLNIICVQNNISKVKETGATILDVTGATLKMADAQITLQQVSGTDISRCGYYESPKTLPIIEV
ncbi:hypothetical protein DCC39_06900 [Pueribacillus theae]|uniref:Hydantoin racemase n=1 Tax=Pueribacillus theae TaxID=2171751 RepID=A0A2U1K3R2_9BACI|nr:aspartate/glutamate racemase family protein [Pueribacillus theae]PWA12156.1 hypothetical protein DCC39_06900 [Pueribacillus theae]